MGHVRAASAAAAEERLSCSLIVAIGVHAKCRRCRSLQLLRVQCSSTRAVRRHEEWQGSGLAVHWFGKRPLLERKLGSRVYRFVVICISQMPLQLMQKSNQLQLVATSDLGSAVLSVDWSSSPDILSCTLENSVVVLYMGSLKRAIAGPCCAIQHSSTDVEVRNIDAKVRGDTAEAVVMAALSKHRFSPPQRACMITAGIRIGGVALSESGVVVVWDGSSVEVYQTAVLTSSGPCAPLWLVFGLLCSDDSSRSGI